MDAETQPVLKETLSNATQNNVKTDLLLPA